MLLYTALASTALRSLPLPYLKIEMQVEPTVLFALTIQLG
jgi:hypothetical protein